MKFSTIHAGLISLFLLAAVSAAPGFFDSMADSMKEAMAKSPLGEAAQMGMKQMAERLQHKNDWRELLKGSIEEMAGKMKDAPAEAQQKMTEFMENVNSMGKDDALKKYGEMLNQIKDVSPAQ